MPSTIFRGATIRYVDLRHEESGVFVRIHLSADFSKPVREAMGWSEIPISVPWCPLKGEILARTLTLTPNGRELRRHTLELECSDVSQFRFVRIERDDEKPPTESLRFVARSVELDAAAKLSAYLATIGHGAAQLKVAYEVQEGLFAASNEEEKQEVDEDGQEPLENFQREPALADSREMMRKLGGRTRNAEASGN